MKRGEEGLAAARPRQDRSKDRWLRRQAIQVTAMLPEDPDDAERVLQMALRLNQTFLREPRPQGVVLIGE